MIRAFVFASALLFTTSLVLAEDAKPAEKAEAILTLATRPESARRLLRELRANRIPKSDVSAFAARQLQRVIGPNFTEFWGPLEIAAADKEAETARLKRLLTDEALAAARPGHGRGVFERTCAP